MEQTRQRHCTTLTVLHDLNLVAQYADEVIVIADRSVLAQAHRRRCDECRLSSRSTVFAPTLSPAATACRALRRCAAHSQAARQPCRARWPDLASAAHSRLFPFKLKFPTLRRGTTPASPCLPHEFGPFGPFFSSRCVVTVIDIALSCRMMRSMPARTGTAHVVTTKRIDKDKVYRTQLLPHTAKTARSRTRPWATCRTCPMR